MSRVSARRELRKPTTGWRLAAQVVGFAAGLGLAPCKPTEFLRGWTQNESWERRCERVSGEFEGKKRLRPRRA